MKKSLFYQQKFLLKEILYVLQNKNVVVMGVANKKYCLGLCKSIKRSRGQCYLYVSKRTHEKQVVKLADENDLLVECDVASDASIQAAFETIKNEWAQSMD